MEICTSTETIVSVSDMLVFRSEGSLEIKCTIPLALKVHLKLSVQSL